MDEMRALLKYARIQAGYSIDDLSRQLDIPYERVLTIESGGRIEADDLFALVNFLNIDPEKVMSIFSQKDWDISTDESIENLIESTRVTRKN